jgi:hypothetical protein
LEDEDVKKDEELVGRTKQIITLLEGFSKKGINLEDMKKILKIQQLVVEK